MKKSIYTGPVRTIDFRAAPNGNDLNLMALIDGVPIADIIFGYAGMLDRLDSVIAERLHWKKRRRGKNHEVGLWASMLFHEHFETVADLPVSGGSGKYLMTCSCGEFLCGGLSIRMKVTNSHVHWYNFVEHRVPYPVFGILTFDSDQYQEACESARVKYHDFLSEHNECLIKPHEESFHDYKTRRNCDQLGDLLHESYSEMDSSGKLRTRQEVLDEAQYEQPVSRKICDYKAQPLNKADLTIENYHVCYLLIEEYAQGHKRRSMRTSIWQRKLDGYGNWGLVFHQSTPLFD